MPARAREMGAGAGGAGDGAAARDGKWAGLAWSSIEMSELRMAGWEGKGGIMEGGLGNSLAGVPCHSPADRQGGARPESGCSVQWEGASSRGWGPSLCAESPPTTALVVPCPCRCKFKTQSGPSLCPTSHRAPLLFFSPNTHCTHSSPRIRRHYCPTQQRPRCSTRFLLLISRCFRHFLTTSPIVPRARSGLTRSTSCSQTILLSTQKDISVFFAFEHNIVPQGEQSCSGELCRLCSRPKDSRLCSTTAVVQSNNKFSCSTRTTRITHL